MTGMYLGQENIDKLANRITELEAENARLRKALLGLPILVSNGHWSRIVIGPWTCSTCGLSCPSDGTYHSCPTGYYTNIPRQALNPQESDNG